MKTGVITKFEKNGIGELETPANKIFKFHASVIVNSGITYTDTLIPDSLIADYAPGTCVQFTIVNVLLKQIAINITKIEKERKS